MPPYYVMLGRINNSMILTEKFEVHNTLNPRLWNSDNTLKSDVKQKINEIVEQFISTLDEVPLNIVDIRIVGSNASYNYTKYSDLDVHIVTNFDLIDASSEILQLMYNALKAKFNIEYDISIHGVDVELYVEDIRSTALSNGVFSVLLDKWIKFPKKLTDVPQVDIEPEFSEWKSQLETALSSNDSDVIMNAINNIYLLRKDSLSNEGEYGKGNLIFKEIRNIGLLDDLRNAYKATRSKELSLENLQRKPLTEASRSNLLTKSKQSQKGMERFRKRVKSRVANTVKQYNNIDMNKLFKDDILTVDVQVKGETDTYVVKISFGGFLEILHDQLKHEPTFNLKVITRALITGFNRDDVYIHCSCPDAQYRFAYWQTRNSVNSGDAETRSSDITNPNDSLGSACKHVLLVLSNTSWILKVASTIFNYVNYMEKHYQRLYADVIYPAIYQKEYEEPVQLDMLDDNSDQLTTDSDLIDKSNVYARDKNKFKQGNTQGVRFAPSVDKNQISIDDTKDA